MGSRAIEQEVGLEGHAFPAALQLNHRGCTMEQVGVSLESQGHASPTMKLLLPLLTVRTVIYRKVGEHANNPRLWFFTW